MSKQGSEVAFIPDNISNISSGKEKFNQDTSQKIEDSYISKLTKFQQFENAPENVQVKPQTQQKFEFRDNPDPKAIVEAITKKISQQNMEAHYVNSNSEKPVQRKFILHKYIKQPAESISPHTQTKRYYHHDSDNTYLYGKHTQTDVISEKESFVEEQHEVEAEQNSKKHEKNVVHFDSVEDIEKNYKKNSSSRMKDYTQDLKETLCVTQINKYDEFETQIGWLQHCVHGNVKYLLRQTNQLLDYNNAVMIEIEKIQLRTKIIELEIQTNKLKIALRKSPSSKHINFSVDLKFKRPTLLKIPKKVDVDMRKYCAELEKTVTQLRNMSESNQKQLSLLEFYQNQFEKKVTYAYIYQEYLIEKAKKQLNNSTNTIDNKIKNSPRKNGIQRKNTGDSLYLTRSPSKKQKVVLMGSSRNSSRKSYQDSESEINQSITSLADRLKRKQNKMNSTNFFKKNLRTQEKDGYGDRSSFSKINRQTQKIIHPTTTQYYTEIHRNAQTDRHVLSPTKNISLTHHKDLSLPSNKKYIQLSNNSINKSLLPLFNTPNRQKKHFFYECQVYLKELEKNYLCQCESEKRNALLTNQNGFRQRELLRMKSIQMKNQILDTEVDIITKEKQLNKENEILKRELQLLQNEIFTKYQNSDGLKSPNKLNKTVRSPNKLKNLLPQQYDTLYKQAQHRLQTYKSTAMLQNVRPNIPKSPKKVSSQKSLEKFTFGRDKLQLKNSISQNQNSRTLKTDPKNQFRKMSKSPVLVRFRKSSQKSNKFLHRFKTTLSEDFLNFTMTENNPQSPHKHNQSPTIQSQTISKGYISVPQIESIEEQYYAA